MPKFKTYEEYGICVAHQWEEGNSLELWEEGLIKVKEPKTPNPSFRLLTREEFEQLKLKI